MLIFGVISYYLSTKLIFFSTNLNHFVDGFISKMEKGHTCNREKKILIKKGKKSKRNIQYVPQWVCVNRIWENTIFLGHTVYFIISCSLYLETGNDLRQIITTNLTFQEKKLSHQICWGGGGAFLWHDAHHHHFIFTNLHCKWQLNYTNGITFAAQYTAPTYMSKWKFMVSYVYKIN